MSQRTIQLYFFVLMKAAAAADSSPDLSPFDKRLVSLMTEAVGHANAFFETTLGSDLQRCQPTIDLLTQKIEESVKNPMLLRFFVVKAMLAWRK